jgi:nitrogen fixation NifU-like protein
MPARVKCAELAWRTLQEMLEAHGATASMTATVSAACDHDHSHDGEVG